MRSLLAEQPGRVRELYLTERCALAHPELPELAERAGLRPRLVDEEIARAMVRSGGAPTSGDPVTPQGAVAVASGATTTWREVVAALPESGPVTVAVIAGLQDPGNVGTVIRTADAAGADLVVLTAGSADATSPKAVRASAGSLFHLPVVADAPLGELLEALGERGISIIATSGRAERDLFADDLPERAAWILGNEGRGVDEQVLERADARVAIPLAGRAESLNVATAAAVCLFEALRRRRAGRTGPPR